MTDTFCLFVVLSPNPTCGQGGRDRIRNASVMPLDAEDYYFENGLMVFTANFHLKRGFCCGNDCRHCPFDHENVRDANGSVPKKKTATRKSEPPS